MSKDKRTDKQVIEETAKQTAKEIVNELKKQGLIKDNNRSAYQKTEILLFNYNDFKAAIVDKRTQIQTLKQIGLPEKSTSITSFSKQPIYEFKDAAEKTAEQIEGLKRSINTTQFFINTIDNALTVLADDNYFDIIRLKYFENKNQSEIAEVFGVDESTITRNKNRLIKKLSIGLFSDDVILELYQ